MGLVVGLVCKQTQEITLHPGLGVPFNREVWRSENLTVVGDLYGVLDWALFNREGETVPSAFIFPLMDIVRQEVGLT